MLKSLKAAVKGNTHESKGDATSTGTTTITLEKVKSKEISIFFGRRVGSRATPIESGGVQSGGLSIIVTFRLFWWQERQL